MPGGRDLSTRCRVAATVYNPVPMALIVGLTGGIGSGKSTVASLLAERGAVIVDADRIVHEMYAVGTACTEAVRQRFGDGVLAEDGSVDRERLAGLVFDDRAALEDLNRIVHPMVGQEMRRRVADAIAEDEDAVVFVEVPLLTETGWDGGAGELWVVVTDPEIATRRLIEQRAMDPIDVRARMAAQTDNDTRRKFATRVIENDGTVEDLEAEVDAAWRELLERVS